eukprot:TRINITY_DN1872_c0_g1_i1.p1 TRINITY_DN1872_c0_g1~~TRINITY_DN1872_c0_g1_i1.p1  ORF type:complete len:216 (-),score=50.82 TRINITY_DN1872_c0_g1_i1:119-766(-)
MFRFLERSKTFRPIKKAPKGTKRYDLHKESKRLLRTGMEAAVQLPPGEDLREWLAVNTVDFYNTTNLLYGSVMEYCTPTDCPVMSAGTGVEYRWADGVKVKKPVKVDAPEYIDRLMSWIEGLLDDESTFPITGDFPKDFVNTVKSIFRRLFRVYAHIYYSHFINIQSLGEEAHLNTCFKFFMLFAFEFDLIPKKEIAPMKDFLSEILGEKYKGKF